MNRLRWQYQRLPDSTVIGGWRITTRTRDKGREDDQLGALTLSRRARAANLRP
jgi:hypothetical protein